MSDAYAGEIRMFGGDYAPPGWHKCDGSLLSVNTYQLLFSLLGTAYGGDGVKTFGIPDLRGRIPVGQGLGPGMTNRVMGQAFGSEDVALTQAQLPAHSHTFAATKAQAVLPSPANAFFGAQTDNDKIYTQAKSGNVLAAMAAATVIPEGGSQPHNNRMPSLGITYIICLEGSYPTRN